MPFFDLGAYPSQPVHKQDGLSSWAKNENSHAQRFQYVQLFFPFSSEWHPVANHGKSFPVTAGRRVFVGASLQFCQWRRDSTCRTFRGVHSSDATLSGRIDSWLVASCLTWTNMNWCIDVMYWCTRDISEFPESSGPVQPQALDLNGAGGYFFWFLPYRLSPVRYSKVWIFSLWILAIWIPKLDEIGNCIAAPFGYLLVIARSPCFRSTTLQHWSKESGTLRWLKSQAEMDLQSWDGGLLGKFLDVWLPFLFKFTYSKRFLTLL